MLKNNEELTYVNGKIVSKNQAKISCFDEGVTHGWAVYEGLRVYNGKIIRTKEHIDRFFDSAKAVNIKVPLSKEELENSIIRTVKANGYKDCHIRPWVSYGEKGGKPNLFIQVSQRKSEMGKKTKAIVSAVRRTACDSIDAKIKTASRLDICLASVEASYANVDYAIMLDKDGYVADIAPGASVFIVKDDEINTPFTTNSLESITRSILMDLFTEDGYTVKEKNMSFKNIYSADEIFVAGTGAEIKRIVEVDGRMIGNGKEGKIVNRAIELYKKFIETEGVEIY
jgi:branched-chain amino acid aminotransferase